MKGINSAVSLLKESGKAALDDKVPMMGAALAYYTAFSIAPILVISIGVVGIVFGDGGGEGVFEAIRGLVGPRGAEAVQSMVQSAASKPRAGIAATVIGALTLLVGASGVFAQLQEALNVIWKVALKPGTGWGVALRRRLLSLGMVGVIAFLLLVSLVVSAGLAAAGKSFQESLPGGEAVWQAVNALVSFAVVAALFALIFKVLPDVRLPWREAFVGGAITSVLFTVGKLAIGFYLGKAGVESAYGAAGSVIVLLLWVYYSSQILLFGAELTRAYSLRSGHPATPKPAAAPISTAFNDTTIARAEVEREEAPNLPGGALWYVAGAAALLGGLGLVGKSAKEAWRNPWTGVLGGLAAGSGLALIALLEARKRAVGDEEEKGPSFASRVLKSIPFRVKAAAVGGAVTKGGKEALREVREKISA